MAIYSLDGLIPVVDPSAIVHPQAVLVGDVIVGPGCYVGPGASLRGDFGRVVRRTGFSNVPGQVHHAQLPSKDARGAHRGGRSPRPRRGAARLHASVRGALVGIGAILMDDVVVEEEAFVGAASFVRAGFVVPRRTLVTGIPARLVRQLKPEELAWKAAGTREYQGISLVRLPAPLSGSVEPLAAPRGESSAARRLGRRAAAHHRAQVAQASRAAAGSPAGSPASGLMTPKSAGTQA